MATETSVIIEAIDSLHGNKKMQKSITNINPQVTDSILYQFAEKLNDISNNSFATAYRIDKKELSGGN